MGNTDHTTTHAAFPILPSRECFDPQHQSPHDFNTWASDQRWRGVVFERPPRRCTTKSVDGCSKIV